MIGPGSEIGGFTIESIAGRGGMGVVYRARQRLPDRVVALKVISAEFARTRVPDALRARGRDRRADRASERDPRLRGRRGDGTLFIAMRFVDGTDLRTVLSQEGRLEPGRAARSSTRSPRRSTPRTRAAWCTAT